MASGVLPVTEASQIVPLQQGIQTLDNGNFVLGWDAVSFPLQMTLALSEVDVDTRQVSPPVAVTTTATGVGSVGGGWFALNGSGRGVVVWVGDTAGQGISAGDGHLRLITVRDSVPAKGSNGPLSAP